MGHDSNWAPSDDDGSRKFGESVDGGYERHFYGDGDR
jgi:hypothetical protein